MIESERQRQKFVNVDPFVFFGVVGRFDRRVADDFLVAVTSISCSTPWKTASRRKLQPIQRIAIQTVALEAPKKMPTLNPKKERGSLYHEKSCCEPS
jgi:hypothetical protein